MACSSGLPFGLVLFGVFFLLLRFVAFCFSFGCVCRLFCPVIMKIISWNCQGAAARSFLRAAKWIVSMEQPTILALYETKISGGKAN